MCAASATRLVDNPAKPYLWRHSSVAERSAKRASESGLDDTGSFANVSGLLTPIITSLLTLATVFGQIRSVDRIIQKRHRRVKAEPSASGPVTVAVEFGDGRSPCRAPRLRAHRVQVSRRLASMRRTG